MREQFGSPDNLKCYLENGNNEGGKHFAMKCLPPNVFPALRGYPRAFATLYPYWKVSVIYRIYFFPFLTTSPL